jgi:large subunit ribosomal protein LP0
MVKKGDRAEWKAQYFCKIRRLLEEYPRIFIVGADNVRSKQMQQIRHSLRGIAEILMGKNTMMCKAIRGEMVNNPNLEKILPHIKGNVGLVFSKEDPVLVRDKLLENKVAAPARAGAIAPCDVVVPAQNTGMGPEKTSFFQALNISTKIAKGTIEIVSDVPLISTGDKVGQSEATLLQMLNITPFAYGLVVENIYDQGAVFAPSVLDITDDQLLAKFSEGVAAVAAVSLNINYCTQASLPHTIINGFKNVLAVAVQTEITFPAAEMAKKYLEDPSAFAVAAAPAAEAAAPVETKEAVKEESESEESDDDMGFGLFD